MSIESLQVGSQAVLEVRHLQSLIDALAGEGYRVLGPRLQEGAINYANLSSVEQLPAGWTDEQAPGRYACKPRGDDALFGYSTAPQSWKRFLHPPVLRLFRAEREDGTFRVVDEKLDQDKLAFLGVRPCELGAIAIQDRVFLGGAYVESRYRARRENLFVIAVNCTQAGGDCFCASMQSGPRAESGYDLALTEVLQDGRHYFYLEVGSESGARILSAVEVGAAGDAERIAAEQGVEQAAQQTRRVDIHGLKEILSRNLENPLWDQPAARCMTCANCTLVCPTCFCTNVEDVTDLTATHAERWRKWDSCFTVDFSYIHGGSIRASAMSRYRQWVTHKLAAWSDQFGTPGCVGCGRCITWCPAGIDLTEQVKAIRESERR